MAVAGVAGEVGHGERQHRPQPLAARRNQVVGDLRDHRDFGTGPRQNRAVDAFHVGRDKLNQPIYRWRRVALKGYNNRHVRSPDEFEGTIETAVRCGKSNDVVLMSAVGALLDGANIHHLVLDSNMSIMDGSLGVLPRRILVHEDDNLVARRLLTDAGLAHELRDND
jgi:hypothetical protein